MNIHWWDAFWLSTSRGIVNFRELLSLSEVGKQLSTRHRIWCLTKFHYTDDRFKSREEKMNEMHGGLDQFWHGPNKCHDECF